MTNTISKRLIYLLLALPLFIYSCNDDDDETIPVLEYDIKSFKNRAHGVVSDSSFVTGVVIGNDASGNLANSLYLQDSTGGIRIYIDEDKIYENFVLGEEIKISTKGLYFNKDAKNGVEIGGYDEGSGDSSYRGITETEVRNHFTRTGASNTIEAHEIFPTTVLSDTLVGSLVKINRAQFVEVGMSYAEAGDEPTKRTLEGPTGGTKYVFTNASANFASQTLPNGQGSITAILGKVDGEYGLYINEVEDVELDEPRTDYNIFYREDFADVKFKDTEFEGWQNIIEHGKISWMGESGYVSASAYYGGVDAAQNVTWLISEDPISLSGYSAPKAELMLRETTPSLTEPHTLLEIYISETYNPDELEIDKNAWGEPVAVVKSGDLKAQAWTPLEDIDFSAYANKNVYIAFRYVGSKITGATSTFNLNYITFYEE
ncbi:DUF5689 domain-containing protein [Sediminitomix flava]|uniref:DUF5689 domain-containing protein n=1 Tax=Sediminitomix flava TaxID=379075 RepID=A0A315Z6A9_SEDFL|nr:DUF5689 domain-containing protein [Sediminitomix flava]PWJ39194.1 hypothetical protein BC781_10695 [Sediminitomix flava]